MKGGIVLKTYTKAVLRPVWGRLKGRIEGIAAAHATGAARNLSTQLENSRAEVAELKARLEWLYGHVETINGIAHQTKTDVQAMRHSVYAPDPNAWPSDDSAPFMQFDNCQAADFYHPRFAAFCKLMGARPYMHRKQWEWVYILHKLTEAGVLKPGMRGLGFGVGTEPLPAVYASMGVEVTATDAPDELDTADTWHSNRQHSGSIEQLLYPHLVPDDLVRKLVTHRPCDMNAIPDDLQGYDFNWSSCCFEHLGSIALGLDFIVNAVEKTLKVGGVAVHTTELNMSSDDKTVSEGHTVLFRERDLRELIDRLRARGHHVEDLRIGPAAHALDFHVDVAPYSHDLHLKLLLAGFVTTSVGIVVRRGK